MRKFADPNKCPHCGSEQIEAKRPDEMDTTIRQEVWCMDCSGEWTDCYEFDRQLVYGEDTDEPTTLEVEHPNFDQVESLIDSIKSQGNDTLRT